MTMRKPAFCMCENEGADQLRRHCVVGFRKKGDCTIYVAKTKALISLAVTAKLVCVFVFAYAYRWFYRDTAHIPGFRLNNCSPFCKIIAQMHSRIFRYYVNTEGTLFSLCPKLGFSSHSYTVDNTFS